MPDTPNHPIPVHALHRYTADELIQVAKLDAAAAKQIVSAEAKRDLRAVIFCAAVGCGLLALALDEGIRRDPVLAIITVAAAVTCFGFARQIRQERL